MLSLLAQVVPNPEDIEAFARLVFDAVRSSNWKLVAALAVVALVWAIRKFIGVKLPFLASDRGGVLLTIVTSAAGAVATALVAGKPFDVALLTDALTMAITAVGGFTAVKKLVSPKDVQLANAQSAGAAARAAVTSVDKAIETLKKGGK